MAFSDSTKKMQENGHSLLPASEPKEQDLNATAAAEVEAVEGEAECGIGGCKPQGLRVLASIGVFTGVYSVSALFTSTLSSYVNSQVTTLERHFGFNSSQTGLIMAANDVGFLVMVLFISYIANKIHIPRALGLVTILFGISGIICALPQFMFGAPSPSSTRVINANVTTMTSAKSSFAGQLCEVNRTSSFGCASDDILAGQPVGEGEQNSWEMSEARRYSHTALVIIVMGMVLQGVAKTPRGSFGTTYIDANVRKTKTGFLMGIITSVAIMGPALAFALGGTFSRIYVTLEDTDMSPYHPRWIGAWWLGYITFGCAACVFALPLFCFPRRIKMTSSKVTSDPSTDTASVVDKIIHLIKGFLPAICRLLTNTVFMCTVLSTCSLLFSVAGGQAFAAKYIENQFSFPAWIANMALAGMMLGTACLGTFLGGYLTKRYKMGPMISLKFTVVMQLLAVVSQGVMMTFKCDQPYLYNSPGPRATPETTLSGCYDDCGCDDNDYFPVCGDDGRTFFSPCHAGCSVSLGRTDYTNCTCIEGGTATAGMCNYSCSMFIPYMVFMCCSALFGTFSIIPKLIIYIRSVSEEDKPLALGFASFMTSITGWMLGPIVFGKLIDGICIQWEKPCTMGGACRLYDNDNFRFKLLGYQAIFRFIGFVFVLVAWLVAKCRGMFDEKALEKKVPQEMSTMLVNNEKGDKPAKN